jgi:hypothetical protein
VRRVGAAYVTFRPFAGWSDDSDRMLRIVARDDEGPGHLDPLILAGAVPVSGSLVVWVRLSND